jgi:hypothetical protein
MIDHVVTNFEAVFAYMDDLWVSSPDRQTHLIPLEALFAALAPSGLAINLAKCVFAVPNFGILSHTISAVASAPLAGHTAAINTCPFPQDIKQLQRFLGTVIFTAAFSPVGAPTFCSH